VNRKTAAVAAVFSGKPGEERPPSLATKTATECEIPPSHGTKASKPTFCPDQYATGGILRFDEKQVKRSVQDSPKFFPKRLLSLKLAVKQNSGLRLSAMRRVRLYIRFAAPGM
jgi:hypothetical protein